MSSTQQTATHCQRTTRALRPHTAFSSGHLAVALARVSSPDVAHATAVDETCRPPTRCRPPQPLARVQVGARRPCSRFVYPCLVIDYSSGRGRQLVLLSGKARRCSGLGCDGRLEQQFFANSTSTPSYREPGTLSRTRVTLCLPSLSKSTIGLA